jgi:hypothetical protein
MDPARFGLKRNDHSVGHFQIAIFTPEQYVTKTPEITGERILYVIAAIESIWEAEAPSVVRS